MLHHQYVLGYGYFSPLSGDNENGLLMILHLSHDLLCLSSVSACFLLLFDI